MPSCPIDNKNFRSYRDLAIHLTGHLSENPKLIYKVDIKVRNDPEFRKVLKEEMRKRSKPQFIEELEKYW